MGGCRCGPFSNYCGEYSQIIGGIYPPSPPGFGTPAYNDNYLNLGFTSVKANGEVRQRCVLCLEVLARSSLKEAKLRRCLETKHVKYVDENH